jgi:hypothetical protein
MQLVWRRLQLFFKLNATNSRVKRCGVCLRH